MLRQYRVNGMVAVYFFSICRKSEMNEKQTFKYRTVRVISPPHRAHYFDSEMVVVVGGGGGGG